MTLRAIGSWLACAAALAATPGPALAAGYTYATLLDQSTPRPDGKGDFAVDWPLPVGFDGQHIAFIDTSAQTQTLWLYTVATKKVAPLVALGAHAPGGTGAFTNFVPGNNEAAGLGPKIAGNKVYFWAEDAAGGSGYGLYWVALSGGGAHRVLNHLTPVPEGGTLPTIGSFFVSGDLALVNAGAVYVGTSAGAAPVPVVDVATRIYIGAGPYLYGCYAGAAIDGTTVAVTATNCFDPSRGVNAIFVGPYDHFATLHKRPVVDQDETLPGDGTAAPHLDVVSWNIFLSGSLLSFGAADTFASPSLYGYYYAPFGADGAPPTAKGSPISRIFDSATSGVAGDFGGYGGAAFWQGALAFMASDDATGTPGAYVASGPMPVLATSNLERGFGPISFAAGALALGGSGFFDSKLILVTPGACGAGPVAGLGISAGPVTPAKAPGQYTQAVTVTAKQTVAGPIDLLVRGLVADQDLLGRAGTTTCVPPIGTPYLAVAGSGTSLAQGQRVSLTLDIASPGSAAIATRLSAIGGAGTP